MDRTDSKNDTPMARESSPAVLGYVYFVKRNDFIKIGSSISPEGRIKGLQTGFPEPLEVLAVVPDTVIGEMEAHRKFAHLRTTGEWFRSAPDLLEFINEVKAKVEKAPLPLKVLLETLRRQRASMSPSKQAHASNLIEQIKWYMRGTAADRERIQPFMARSMMLLECAQ